MKIVFMGTPQFAVPSLKALLDNGYEIAAAVTQPDRKSGRGYKITESPVKLLAEKNNIPVLQFEKIKSPEGVEALKKISPEVIITAAFGQILSKAILDIPPLGCLNVHASLLPEYRGAAPIQWAIINGETETGVTIMYMDEKLDTGDIVSSVQVQIGEKMTGGELYDELSMLGAGLLIEALKEIEKGKAKRIKQDDTKASYFPPLSKELGKIDWNKPASEIYNLVRALDPVMGTYSSMSGEVYKIWSVIPMEGNSAPGKIVKADAKDGLIVGTGSGLLRINVIQTPGAKKMNAADFLRGRKLNGDTFE